MVPSWTETLIRAGVNVVGRTRFCIEPAERVDAIPQVGGTKDIDWSIVEKLNADFLILDREENPKWMADQSKLPVLVTHARSLQSVANDLNVLSQRLNASALTDLARRWQSVADAPPSAFDSQLFSSGVSWWREPTDPPTKIVYLIWRRPWMSVAAETFIGHMLSKMGCAPLLPAFSEPYPKVAIEEFCDEDTWILLSTEPYPFARFREAVTSELPKAAVGLVDGQCFSWFGVRSLEYIEAFLKKLQD